MVLTPTTHLNLATDTIRKKMDRIRICIGLSSSYTELSSMFNNITLEKTVSFSQVILFISPHVKYLLCLACHLEIAACFFIPTNSVSLCTVAALKENSENM